MFVKDLAVTINCEGCNCVVMVTNTCCVPQTMHRIKTVHRLGKESLLKIKYFTEFNLGTEPNFL